MGSGPRAPAGPRTSIRAVRTSDRLREIRRCHSRAIIMCGVRAVTPPARALVRGGPARGRPGMPQRGRAQGLRAGGPPRARHPGGDGPRPVVPGVRGGGAVGSTGPPTRSSAASAAPARHRPSATRARPARGPSPTRPPTARCRAPRRRRVTRSSPSWGGAGPGSSTSPQEHPGRLVALKMLLGGDHGSPEQRARILREADAIARLRHPGIVQIHGVGRHGEIPFLTLEYVPGGSLARRLDAGADAAASRGRDGRVARPRSRLRQRGGRPPRPEAGERPARRRGSAEGRRLRPGQADRADLTATGAILGTPSYIAPSSPPAAAAPGRRPTSTPLARSSTSASPAGLRSAQRRRGRRWSRSARRSRRRRRCSNRPCRGTSC